MSEYKDCTQCPHDVSDAHQRDCAWPDCQGGWDAVFKQVSDERDTLKAETAKFKGLLGECKTNIEQCSLQLNGCAEYAECEEEDEAAEGLFDLVAECKQLLQQIKEVMDE